MLINKGYGHDYPRGAGIDTRMSHHLPDAMVQVNRHIKACEYYTDYGGDTIGCFVKSTVEATAEEILEYTFKMVIQKRDTAVIEDVLEQLRSPTGSTGTAGTQSDK
ncbi:unnamed protein product [Euphydryas editha]|uniref:Uncharacterized protein n=1 Tax=Euphydryas editha TaxID=104508 RepID=A0AAU9UFT8_EUPED|nr:unnamed protein product [Euphydryas editha]